MNIWVIIYRFGWIAIGILLLILIVSIFVPQVQHYQELHRKEAVLQDEIRMEEEMLRHLKEQQERLRTDPRFIEKVAREEFGYVRPGETVFRFVDEQHPTNRMTR